MKPIDLDYQYDTPVSTPSVIDAERQEDDELGGSIGDLAPGRLARA